MTVSQRPGQVATNVPALTKDLNISSASPHSEVSYDRHILEYVKTTLLPSATDCEQAVVFNCSSSVILRLTSYFNDTEDVNITASSNNLTSTYLNETHR